MNTEIFSIINWPALLVASLGYFMFGALWYSKVLFGARWAALVNLDMTDPDLKKGMGKMMASTFLLIVIICLGLTFLIAYIGFDSQLHYGLKLGLLTGLSFATTAVSMNYVYENKPLQLYLINNGYHVFGHVIAATILVMWR